MFDAAKFFPARRLLVALALLASFILVALIPGALRATIEGSEHLVSITLRMDANRPRGAQRYHAECASCHGPNAHGDADRLVPALAGQRRAYLIKQLADFAEHDRIATKMHVVIARETLRDPQAWADLALYLNGLQPQAHAQTGTGESLDLGEASYEQWCASCHEEDGRGDDDGFVPSLRGQHYGYLEKEIRSLAMGHRFNTEDDLSRFLNSLESDEIAGIADYVSRMSGPIKDRAQLKDDGTVSD